MHDLEKIPKHIIKVGSTHFNCVGSLPEHHAIEVEGHAFTSLSMLTKYFPELTQHPAALAKCVNFLLMGDLFCVISNPIQFQEEYLGNSKELDLSKIFCPYFENNSFIFFAWNQINDTPYKVTCLYPFSDNLSDVTYELVYTSI